MAITVNNAFLGKREWPRCRLPSEGESSWWDKVASPALRGRSEAEILEVAEHVLRIDRRGARSILWSTTYHDYAIEQGRRQPNRARADDGSEDRSGTEFPPAPEHVSPDETVDAAQLAGGSSCPQLASTRLSL